MITVEKINNPDYLVQHSKHEYYTEGDSKEGYFAGRLMQFQKLAGKEVDGTTFKKMLDFGKKDGFAGVEFDPAPPKDFSILLERATDPERLKLLELHKEAIARTMKVIEQNTYYRKTENGITRYEHAKAVGMAHFTHFTARPTIDKEGNTKIDMQLHEHIVVFPKVLGQDGKFHSHTLLDTKYEKHNGHETLRLFDQTYQATLAKGLQSMGYSIERGAKDSFKIKGISDELVSEFSKRKNQIIDKVGEDASYGDKKKASLKARNKKVVSDLNVLRPQWQEKMDAMGFTQDKMNSIKEKQQDKDASFDEIFKDKSVISQKELRIKALSESKYSTKTADMILSEFKKEKMHEVSKEHSLNPKTKAGKQLSQVKQGDHAKGQKQESSTGKASDNIQVALNNLKGQYQAKLAEVATKKFSKPGREAGELAKVMSEFNAQEAELSSQLAQALSQESQKGNDFDI